MILPWLSSAEGDKTSETVKYRSGLKHRCDWLDMTFVSHPVLGELLAEDKSTRLLLGKNCRFKKAFENWQKHWSKAKKWKLVFATGGAAPREDPRRHALAPEGRRVSAPASNGNLPSLHPSCCPGQFCCRCAALARPPYSLAQTAVCSEQKTCKTPKKNKN